MSVKNPICPSGGCTNRRYLHTYTFGNTFVH